MKEATGELSTTVIAIVAIAAVLAIFTAILLPQMKRSIALSTACNSAGGGDYHQELENEDIIDCARNGEEVVCTYTTAGGATNTKTCENEDVEA